MHRRPSQNLTKRDNPVSAQADELVTASRRLIASSRTLIAISKEHVEASKNALKRSVVLLQSGPPRILR